MKRLAITSLLAALLFSGCQSIPQKQIYSEIAAKRMVKQLALGCHLYAQENDGMLPTELAELEPYVLETFDPQDYVLEASGKLHEIMDTPDAVLARQKEPLPNGRQIVALVDGRAAMVAID